MFSVKIHSGNGENVLACCDEDILGETFEEGELHLHVSENFYNGEKVDKKGLTKLLSGVSSANIVGVNAVEYLVDTGVIKEEGTITVAGIKHAQIYRL